jgi:hypothetical protein
MQAADINSNFMSAIGIAILVGVVWCAICFFSALISGWLTLARQFKSGSQPYGDNRTAGPFLYRIYMRIWTQYSWLIRLTAGADALYLSVFFPFRIGHPPLCIPWNEIQFSTTKRFWLTYFVLTLGNKQRIPMRISRRMARNLGILEQFPAQSSGQFA